MKSLEWLDLETGIVFSSGYFDARFFGLQPGNWNRFAILGVK